MMKLPAIGGFLGSLAVVCGTFGVHGLTLGAQAASWWETGTLYLLVHAGVVVALGVADEKWHFPGYLFAPGALIFAGTLYAMALGAPRWLGAITPIGGTLMLAGWGLLFILGNSSATKKPKVD